MFDVLYLLIIGSFSDTLAFSELGDKTRNTENHSGFLVSREKEEIVKVEILQGEDIPTGEVYVYFKNDETARFYVSDVNKIIDEVESSKISYQLSDVQKPSWFWTYMHWGAGSPLAVLFTVMVGTSVITQPKNEP